jgi:hypothetical protein
MMAAMPNKKEEPSADELARMLWQAEAKAGDILTQQMLDHLAQQTAFETVCGEFGAPDDDDDWADRKDETTAVLAQVAAAEKAKVVYVYDFGDDWRHDIVVEKILPAEPGVAYPRCTGGRREAPPEDCGGIWAFNDYQAERDDTFDAGALTARLAALAKRPGVSPG